MDTPDFLNKKQLRLSRKAQENKLENPKVIANTLNIFFKFIKFFKKSKVSKLKKLKVSKNYLYSSRDIEKKKS